MARWSLHIQSYDFQIKHRSVTKNIVPDTLSRYNVEEMSSANMGIINPDSPALRSVEYSYLIANIQTHQVQLPDVKVVDKFIYKRTQPYSENRS